MSETWEAFKITCGVAPAAGAITLNTAAFRKALSKCAMVVEHRCTIPILSCVRVRTIPGGGLSLETTNLDTSIQVTLDGREDDNHFDAMLPYRHLMRLLPLATAETLTLSITGTSRVDTTLIGGNLRALLCGYPVTDFPEFKLEGPFTTLTLTRDALLTALTRVSFAMSYEETRYYLNGVYMHPTVGGGGVTMVAIDGHRMAMDKIKADTPEGLRGGILPKDLIKVLMTKLGNHKGDVIFDFPTSNEAKARGRVTIGDTTISFKLIDGTYPEYSRVIPKPETSVASLKVGSRALRTISQAMSTLSKRDSRPIAFDLGKETRISSVNQDDGITSTRLDSSYTGPAGMRVGFQARYIAQMADRLDGMLTASIISEGGDPITWKCDTAPDWLGILMPMRI